jgi:hypothetical protein
MACSVVQVVRSIHVTGHSLGGALASLSAFDLSTTVAAAKDAKDDPLTSKKCKQLKKDLAVGHFESNQPGSAICKWVQHRAPAGAKLACSADLS